MVENTKKWEETGRRYRTYIKLEKRLSENTVESYMRDLRQFAHFILRLYAVAPRKVERTCADAGKVFCACAASAASSFSCS